MANKESKKQSKKQILILGGGFAGVKCARRLRTLLPEESHNIIVFNRENHMVFHPLLAEVASAAVQPKDVGAPLRQLLHHVQCRTEDILSIDLDNNLVEYEAHDGKRRQMKYDQVVLACGNAPNLALVPGMDEHAFGLKTIGDALALQAHIMQRLEKAEVCDDLNRKRWYLSFIVVGGGFSGVEVAGEINDLLHKSLRFFENIKPEDISVVIIHSRDQILPEVSQSLRLRAQAKMEEAGVKFLLSAHACRATPDGIALKDGRILPAGTIVCTVGTNVLPIVERLNVLKKNNRIAAEPDMSVPGYLNAWAIGDCAAIVNALDNQLCPTVAQFAERQGVQVADNIVSRLQGLPTKPFSFKMQGQLCAIGGRNAVAEISGLHISGFIGWFIWRGVYLMKLPSLSQKIKVGLEWGCDLIFPRTLAHLRADPSKRVSRAFYAAGDLIFNQGDAATEFFMIEEGEVEVLKMPESSNNAADNSTTGSAVNDAASTAGDVVAVLGPGDFFGEAALINDRPRNATVRARTDVEVVVLGRSVFTQISIALSPLRDAVAKAVKRRASPKSLDEYRNVLGSISLSAVTDALPGAPLQPESTVENAIERINKHRLDFCCVVNKSGLLVGIVTRTDLLSAIEVATALQDKKAADITIKEIMVKDPVAITLEDTTLLALLTMREHGLKRVPVLESRTNRTPKGYVRIENIMDHVVRDLGSYKLVASNAPMTREIDFPKLD
ncbi:FAD-dependent oxidoreductase [bacterium]|nr:FAD-dependent oxidoreductase [bacterium]MBP9807033.1 FAD-dependent oxidoreductase [bacterium]